MSAVPYDKKQAATLVRMNVWAFALHFLSFTAALTAAIIFVEGSFQAILTTTFLEAEVPKLTVVATYFIIWLELPFPLITALFHFVIAFFPLVRRRYLYLALVKERNPLRWVEYSITASIMTWVICQVSGITDVLTLVLVVGITPALMATGHLMEIMNVPSRKRVYWLPTTIGWWLFVLQWAIIITAFLAAVTSSANDVPWFVYTIVIGLFFQFSAFGFVQLVHYTQWPGWFITGYNTERAFIILSFVSKFFLDWALLTGILSNMR